MANLLDTLIRGPDGMGRTLPEDTIMENRTRIGTSACLLGKRVRYDGECKRNHYVTDTLGRFFILVPICPEVGCGLPVPREAMRLEGDPQRPRLVVVSNRTDLTELMLEYCRTKVTELEREELCGFIVKKNSPSCGLFRVKVYNKGIPPKNGQGLFVAAMAKHFPSLPIEEEGRLDDTAICGNFIERVFAFRSWKEFLRGRKGLGELLAFHTVHKLQLMAHSPQLYRELGKLVASGKGMNREKLLARYEKYFMEALSLHATVNKQIDVLMHIMGYFKKKISTAEKAELLDAIQRYHDGIISLIVPLTLLRHYAARCGEEYLGEQTYIKPHPTEFMLRGYGQ